MRHFLIGAVALSTLACNLNKTDIKYPETKKVDSSATYFGTQIKEPYAWLEDDYSDETIKWVDAQNQLTQGYLKKIPQREILLKEMPKYWDYEQYGVPKRTKAGLIYSYNDGKMNQPVVMVSSDSNARVILDPNTLSEDGTASLNSYSVSPDGTYLAYAISEAGSDWAEINVKNLNTNEMLVDKVSWVKFSGISWDKDGFYYSAFPKPTGDDLYSAKNEFHKVYYHKLGAKEDVLIFEDANSPQKTFGSELNEDKTHLFIYGATSTSGNSVHIRNLKTKKVVTTVGSFENDFNYLGDHNNGFLFLTNHNAPNNRVIWIDPKNPEESNWKEIIAEKESLLQSVEAVPNGLVCNYLEDVVSKLTHVALETGEMKALQAPENGNISNLKYDKEKNQLFFAFEGYVNPNTVYALSDFSKPAKPFNAGKLKFNPNDFEVIQEFYTSKDGTQIPIFITQKKGLEKTPETPCFLYAYGGFNISIQPHFKPDRMAFLNAGGIYAVANIRGGSEYGEAWHEAGTKMNKQNVFDDFIAAATYLQGKGYTSAEKMAVHGRSNGGLLAGAVLTQRPDLFAVALPKVGVLDMLKYHQFTIGWAWAADYGRSDDSKEMFEYLKNYSPLHNAKPQDYPATMIITGDHDDRVVPAHSFKFAAAMQEAQQGSEPILLRVDKNAGHGAGKPVEKQVEEFADQWAFVMKHIGMEI